MSYITWHLCVYDHVRTAWGAAMGRHLLPPPSAPHPAPCHCRTFTTIYEARQRCVCCASAGTQVRARGVPPATHYDTRHRRPSVSRSIRSSRPTESEGGLRQPHSARAVRARLLDGLRSNNCTYQAPGARDVRSLLHGDNFHSSLPLRLLAQMVAGAAEARRSAAEAH